MTVPEILKAIEALPPAEQQSVAEALNKSLSKARELQEELDDFPEEDLRHSLISSEDEKNILRIWKSPGGC
jgi:hypothetical protein